MPPWQGWIYALGSCGGDALTFWREVLTVVSMTHFLQNQVTHKKCPKKTKPMTITETTQHGRREIVEETDLSVPRRLGNPVADRGHHVAPGGRGFG